MKYEVRSFLISLCEVRCFHLTSIMRFSAFVGVLAQRHQQRIISKKCIFLLVTFTIILNFSTFAQNPIFLSIKDENNQANNQSKIFEKYNFKRKFTDTISAKKETALLIESLQEDGFLECFLKETIFIKSSKNVSDTLKITIFVGKQFIWGKLSAGNLPKDIQLVIDFREKFFQNTPFSAQKTKKLQNKILSASENSGYPFAKIKFDSLQIIDNQEDNIQKINKVVAKLYYESGKAIAFDTIALRGNLKISKKFLYKYLQIKRGNLYNQQKINKIDNLLKRLPFITLTKPTEVYFDTGNASPQIYANQQKSNQIDGIIGFLPNEVEPNKLLLTGQLSLKLRNLFGTGQHFEAEFQQLKPSNTLLNVEYRYPVLFGSALDVQGNFNFLREDTTFININRQILVSYNFNNLGKLNFSVGLRTSQLGFGQQNKDDVSFAGTSFLNYGLGYEWNNLDDFYFPKNGYKVNFTGFVGTKNIIFNPQLSLERYKNIPQNSTQIDIRLQAEKYVSFTPKKVFLAQISAQKLFNDYLLANELYRLGGLQNLRGFNQNFFFVSAYALTKLEYRYFWEENSFFFLFYDQAFTEQRILGKNTPDNPLGVGLGISLNTRAGLLTLAYALGQSNTENINIARSKLHFGLVSRF